MSNKIFKKFRLILLWIESLSIYNFLNIYLKFIAY